MKQDESLEMFKQAVDSAKDMIFITDPEGIVLYINPACYSVTGYPVSQVVGRKIGAVWNTPKPESFYTKFWRTIKVKKRVYEGEVRNYRRDGDIYDARLKMSPVLGSDGSVKYYIGIERDITHEKNIERSKNDFISLASHQLRTPPSIIKWSLEEIEHFKRPLSSEQYKLLSQIKQANYRMIQLVDAMLNISRLELGTFMVRPELVHVPTLINNELHGLTGAISQKKLQVSAHYAPELSTLKTDRNLLQIILQNLITNAIKYTPAGGSITVSVAQSARYMRLKVADTGCGIPQSQQSRVFDKLFRADNARQIDTNGNGLGLYLTKQLVDFMKGSIRFTSIENKGTTFYVNLPRTGLAKKDGVTQLVPGS